MNAETQALLTSMVDQAESMNADANDDSGIVRAIVTANGLGFYAWFCVCCELADRNARKQGFKDQSDRASQAMKQAVTNQGGK